MPLLAFACFICVLLIVGIATTSLLYGQVKLHICEMFGLHLLTGIGAFGFLLFWLSLLSITPGTGWLIACLIGLIIAGVFRSKGMVSRWLAVPPLHIDRAGATLIFPIAAIVFCIVAIVVNALAFPLYEWDAFAIWFLKAKILLHEALLPQPAYFHDAAMSYSHRDYPLMQPIFIAGFWGFLHRVNDRWGKLVLILPYLAMGLLFFAEARRRLSTLAGGWLTAVFLCAPALPFWAASGDADVMLAAFYLGHLIYLVRWLDTRLRNHLLTSAFFASCMWFTKQEGQVLALISVAIVVIFVTIKERRFHRDVLFFPAMLLVLLLPWHVWSWNLPHSNQRYPEITLDVIRGSVGSIVGGIRLVCGELVQWRSWGALVPLMVLCALLTIRRVRRTSVAVIWLMLLAQLGFLVLAYALAEPNMKLEMVAGVRRLFVQVTPAIALLIVLHFPSIGVRREDTSDDREPLTSSRAAINQK
jgi:hypothetical protein